MTLGKADESVGLPGPDNTKDARLGIADKAELYDLKKHILTYSDGLLDIASKDIGSPLAGITDVLGGLVAPLKNIASKISSSESPEL